MKLTLIMFMLMPFVIHHDYQRGAYGWMTFGAFAFGFIARELLENWGDWCEARVKRETQR